jgi:hypothetical protein
MSGIDWSTLRHAYGPASDIPRLLTEARTAPPPGHYGDEPWFSLWSALYHQDDIYSASYAAVPELLRLAQERHDLAPECLFLAGSIELRRNEPGAPELPPELRPAYERALPVAAELSRAASASNPDVRRMLDIADAVFHADFRRARELLSEDGNADE